MTEAQNTKHFDVLIVGAGISGIGGAYHLQEQCPELSFVILEGLERIKTFYSTIFTKQMLCFFGSKRILSN